MNSPTILGIRPAMLLRVYWWRLRRYTAQEMLACSGIAAGVALVFGVTLANTSILTSAEQVLRGLAGSATLQLAARSPDGFEQRLATRAGALPGVKVAAPLLRENEVIIGPAGRQTIQLVGLTPSVIALNGAATQDLGAGAALLSGGVGISSGVAEAIGARSGDTVTLLTGAGARRAVVRVVLGPETIGGATATGPLVVSLLSVAQQLTGRPGRVTQVLIEPSRGQQALVAAELERLAGGRLNVAGAERELTLLREAAKPTSQSTSLFAAISLIVGFLLALNAVLLTVPQRRRFIADLRLQGFDPRQVLLILCFEALALALIASMLGVILGYVLSHTLFQQVPAYLTFAFLVGPQQTVHLSTVLLAFGCGVLATLLASLPPMLDLRGGRPVDAVFRETEGSEGMGRGTVRRFALVGLALVLVVTVLVLLAPALTIVGLVLLAFAALCLIPAVAQIVVEGLARLVEHIRGGMLFVAVTELRASTTRSMALAGVAALAIYGSVSIGGARHDLTRGLNTAVTQYLSSAEIWVTRGASVFTTESFQAAGTVAEVARAQGVVSVRVYQGGLLDVGKRRLWIRARSPRDEPILQSSQMLQGDFAHASALIREGSGAAVSQGFASERHLRLGESFTLPTPTGPARFILAAITTNTGWAPGAITINTTQYARYWKSTDPAALEVNLKPGVRPTVARRSIEAALGRDPALRVQTDREREAELDANARQGLRTLGEISTLLLIAAALAVACALSAAIWQRRPRLASLNIAGLNYRQLWQALLLESTIVLAVGCIVGALLGVYGHALANRFLQLTTGFPAPFSAGGPQIFLTLTLVGGIALAVIALPGLAAARVSPRAGFKD
ncbi:MAG TPA: FtsX-like permease family protein [Solirubrobacteraceae bacterium]